MTQPTVTLPREVVQKLINDGYLSSKYQPIMFSTLRTALDAPANQITQQMIDAGVAAMYQGAWKSDAAEVKSILMAALGAPATVDCRGCENFCGDMGCPFEAPDMEPCTDFDKFQALPPISLTKVTK